MSDRTTDTVGGSHAFRPESDGGNTATATYRTARVSPGKGGWGQGLVLTPDAQRNTVISVTGGGIHPVAARLGELTGARVVDGFRNHVPDDEVLAAVINCGGTARIGVYPKKRIPTIDVYPGEPGGPLAQFITDDIFVSAVTPGDIAPADGAVPPPASSPEAATAGAGAGAAGGAAATSGEPMEAPGFLVRFGSSIGFIINTFLASGRQTIQLVLSTILPFMAYVSLLLGFVTYTGIARLLGDWLKPLAGNPIGLIVIGIIVAIPVLSPILGPGAAVAQIVGVLMGTQIGTGALPVQYALPTLFAIDGQVGCDFVPVGLGLGEARPETVRIGVPAVLFSRLITSPVSVVIAYLASFGL